jgi:leader peptidase (prepilin peptidase)/N-methyltransferase
MTPFLAAYFTLLVFVFGACVGSFLNVCIYRIPNEESVVRPRSRCPTCRTMIRWYDNIPLMSWIVLRGKCRACGVAISPRYYLVELLTGLLFLLLWNRYGADPLTPVLMLAVSGLILGTFVDFDHMILPDRVTIGGMIVGVPLSALVPSLHGQATWLGGLIASVGGLCIGFGLLWSVALIGEWVFKKDAMGFGDVKLMGAVGAFFGWKAVLFTVLASSLFGSVVGVALIAFGGKRWQSRIPYGPYIALAAVVWMLGGDGLWDAYVGWLSGSWR